MLTYLIVFAAGFYGGMLCLGILVTSRDPVSPEAVVTRPRHLPK